MKSITKQLVVFGFVGIFVSQNGRAFPAQQFFKDPKNDVIVGLCLSTVFMGIFGYVKGKRSQQPAIDKLRQERDTARDVSCMVSSHWIKEVEELKKKIRELEGKRLPDQAATKPEEQDPNNPVRVATGYGTSCSR